MQRGLSWACWVVCFSMLGGCGGGGGGGGGGSAGSAGSGGAGAAAGTAGSGGTGGEAAVVRGAWAVSFFDTGTDCLIASHNAAVGDVSAGTQTKLVEDGEADATISCAIGDSGSGFGLELLASQGGSILQMVIASLDQTASPDMPATGTVSYTSLQTANAFTSQDCQVYFMDETPQGVEAGRVWLTFECPSIAAAVDNICAIQPSYAAFEGCATE